MPYLAQQATAAGPSTSPVFARLRADFEQQQNERARKFEIALQALSTFAFPATTASFNTQCPQGSPGGVHGWRFTDHARLPDPGLGALTRLREDFDAAQTERARSFEAALQALSLSMGVPVAGVSIQPAQASNEYGWPGWSRRGSSTSSSAGSVSRSPAQGYPQGYQWYPQGSAGASSRRASSIEAPPAPPGWAISRYSFSQRQALETVSGSADPWVPNYHRSTAVYPRHIPPPPQQRRHRSPSCIN